MTPEEPRELLAADSFRVRIRDGRAEARGLERHLARFREAIAGSGLEGFLPRFIAESRERIADFGAGFPRLELLRRDERGRPEFDLAPRPLPALLDTIRLRTAPHLAVAQADRKGPNIERYGACARRLGAEPLLVDAAGCALEGGTTSLLWWAGDGALRRVDSEWRVPSVTESLVLDAARAEGIPVRRATVRPGELAGCEVWAVNALHGIRAVARIDDAETPRVDAVRLARFREALDRTWEPVLG